MKTTLVKICGLTNLDDARVAVQAGADLLGFIFYAKSPRYVTPETVAAIVRTLRGDRETGRQGDRETRDGETRERIDVTRQSPSHPVTQSPSHPVTPSPKLVGVFVNASVTEIAAVVEQVGLDFVQLHGHETVDWFADLGGRAYKAMRPADGAAAQAQAEQFAPLGCAAGPCLMIDAYDPQAYGGTGKQTDWHVAAALARQYPRLLLAGGLTPANVAAAIDLVQPWGVDVASGVEAEPGRKDHDKVRQFVRNVRSHAP